MCNILDTNYIYSTVNTVMRKLESYKKIIKEIRDKDIPFISVSNSEWYSLFKNEIRNSIAIEGVFSNRSDLLSVLEEGRKTTNQKTAAILGYFEAASTVYEYANVQYNNNEFYIRLSDIKQIHSLLMRYEKQLGIYNGKLGEFRSEDIEVTEAFLRPLNYLYINDFMRLYVKWINKNLTKSKFDLLELISATHVLFETIHPFRDGNGRVGRILLSYLLIGTGFINISIKGTNKNDRQKYYSALEIADDEYEKMLRLVESGKQISANTINSFTSKSNLTQISEIIFKGVKYSTDRLEKHIKNLDKEALLPLRDAAKFYNYSSDYLRQLIHKKKLPAVKQGKLWYVSVKDIQKYIDNHK